MFEFMGWNEAAKLIENGIAKTIQQKKVTYDLERLMTGATKLGTAAFASAIVGEYVAGTLTDIRTEAEQRRDARLTGRRYRKESFATLERQR